MPKQNRPKKTIRQQPLPNQRTHFPLQGKLHTDVLEAKYGQVHTRILRHDNQIRLAHLEDANGISRTFAITLFPSRPFRGEIAKINEQIKRGEAIGKAFRQNGYEVRKNVIAVYTTVLPETIRQAFMETREKAKVRLSEFLARKGNQKPVVYATVAEIYSPDFRPANINATDRKQVNPTAEALQQAGISLSELWQGIGQNNNWKRKKTAYQRALQNNTAKASQTWVQTVLQQC